MPECVTKMTDDSFQVCLAKKSVILNLLTAFYAVFKKKKTIKIFQVCSSRSQDIYAVELTGCFPRCTCIDWLETELPCKHVFHVLNSMGLSWNELPEVFRFVHKMELNCAIW